MNVQEYRKISNVQLGIDPGIEVRKRWGMTRWQWFKLFLVNLTVVLAVATCNSQTKSKLKATVALKAGKTGVNATHSVTLTGCSDTTAGVTFNFYRGATSGQESSTPLNSTPTATCNFVDTNVTALQTYFYVAKAFCSTCSPNLSPPSNEVQATIPPDPQPAAPTGLGVGTVAKNSVPLHWQPPVKQNGYDVVAYEVQRSVMPALLPGAAKQIAIVPEWHAAFVDTTCPGKCEYAVKAYDIKSNNIFVASNMSNIIAVSEP